MVNIGTTDFFINVPSFPRREFEEYSTQLFDEWESYVDSTLELTDYSLALEVEEGSIKAVGKVAATLGVLYIGIGQYGSFISGLQTIYNQVRTVGDYFSERAVAPFDSTNFKPKVRKRGESLARLQTLFVKVQSGEMSVDEAMKETEALFGVEAESSPEFMNELQNALKAAPSLPQQIQLPLVGADGELLVLETKKQRNPRKPTPKQPVPVPDLYRVEVWRENKKGRRNIRVISL